MERIDLYTFYWLSGYGWGLVTVLALRALADFYLNDYEGKP